MSLAPAVALTVGSLRYETHAALLAAELAPLARGGTAAVRLPPAVRFEGAAGDTAVLALDGGDGVETVLTGKVDRVRRSVDAIEVTVADAGTALARLRPSTTFERQSGKAIIRKLAADADVTTGAIDLDLDLPAYAAHPARTAAEHVARLAAWGDAFALVDADGRLTVRGRPEGPADSALLFGREIVRIEHQAAAPLNPSRFAIGSGPAGSASAPDALRPSPDPLPDSAAEGGADVLRRPEPSLRTSAATATASTALSAAAARAGSRLVLTAFLLPGIRPGQVIEIQDLPDAIPGGPYLVTRVGHRLGPAGGSTIIDAEALAAPSSLLGALAGALGSLL